MTDRRRVRWTMAVGATTAALACLAVMLATRPVQARQGYKFLGVGKCVSCHPAEKVWYEKGELESVAALFPAMGKKAGHLNSMAQLDEPKAQGYATAVGQKDPYNSKCFVCHATVYGGDAQGGVSCEHCHGAASGYVTIHATPGNYAQALAVGMIDVRAGPSKWAAQCAGCHVLKDAALAAAGHPTGADFDLSKKYVPVSKHFKAPRPAAEVASAWGRFRGSPATAAPPPVAAAPPPVAAPPPAATGAPPVAAPPAAAPPVAAPTTPPVRSNPASSGTAAPPPPATSASAVPEPPPFTPPPAPPPPREPAVATASPSTALAALQGRLIAALAQMLQQGGTAPVRQDGSLRPVPYRGPDAGLLQLQAEAIALALQVLSQPPVKPPVKEPK